MCLLIVIGVDNNILMEADRAIRREYSVETNKL